MEPIIYTLLILTSIVGLTFIVERGLALRWRKVVPPEIEAAVRSCQTSEDLAMLGRVCHQYPSPMSQLLLLAAEHLDWAKADTMDAMQARARHEVTRLERGLVVLEIIVGIAPLLGLVGTIIGMMGLFRNIGQQGLNEAAPLAQGIALILNTTLMGLLIAIPSLVFWSYYSKKVETIAIEMETLCDEFIRRQYREAPREHKVHAAREAARK
jgi:biopolymer transport protein ExbB